MNSRCGESINKNLGMDHLIADDYEDYVKKAIILAKDKNLKKNYGNNLRNKALSSPCLTQIHLLKILRIFLNVYN